MGKHQDPDPQIKKKCPSQLLAVLQERNVENLVHVLVHVLVRALVHALVESEETTEIEIPDLLDDHHAMNLVSNGESLAHVVLEKAANSLILGIGDPLEVVVVQVTVGVRIAVLLEVYLLVLNSVILVIVDLVTRANSHMILDEVIQGKDLEADLLLV